MDELINNEPTPLESEKHSKHPTKSSILNIKPYYNVLLTKKGIDKLKNTSKSIFDLPLSDLREPPHIANIYTIGDLVRFIDKHQYIKHALDDYHNNN